MGCLLKVLIGLGVAVVVAVVITCAVVFSRSSSEEDGDCTLTGNSLDYLETIMSNCAEIVISNFEVPAGRSLSLTNLQPGTTVTFRGTITFGYEEWIGHIIIVSGTNITVIGAPGNLIDCRGERWWDGLGANGGVLKPKVLRAYKLYNSTIRGLNIRNSPRHCFSINYSEGVVLSDITMDNLEGDVNGGHNTDAFDLSTSSDITIINNHVVNQDDCVAINSGSNYYIYNNYCSGGHGISIGSVGNRSLNTVTNVHVKNCTIVNSENGVRLKTVFDATGLVSDIVYEDITLRNITDFGIVVRGDYRNIGPTGTPTGGIPINNLTLRNIQGWVQSNATNVYVLLANDVARNWSWSNINVSGSTHTNVNCTGVPENSGVVC